MKGWDGICRKSSVCIVSIECSFPVETSYASGALRSPLGCIAADLRVESRFFLPLMQRTSVRPSARRRNLLSQTGSNPATDSHTSLSLFPGNGVMGNFVANLP